MINYFNWLRSLKRSYQTNKFIALAPDTLTLTFICRRCSIPSVGVAVSKSHRMGAAPITISADDVNALVYAYFQDSGENSTQLARAQGCSPRSCVVGFQHSAFCLNVEAGFGPSHRDTYVRRGQLVDLLSKALLYTEVESHWRADVVTTTCQTPFSLLKDHVCSPDATQTPVPVLEKAAALKAGRIDEIHIAPTSALGSSSVKRKASESAVVEAPLEKRARTSTPMDGPNGTCHLCM